jgi:hypothetical protein
MIVRILGEGQLEVPDAAVDDLNELDRQLEAAVDRRDEAAFGPALAALLAKVREIGSPARADELRPSELIVPPDDASMADVRRLLTDEGLIPG